jgi:hypothetical protein
MTTGIQIALMETWLMHVLRAKSGTSQEKHWGETTDTDTDIALTQGVGTTMQVPTALATCAEEIS